MWTETCAGKGDQREITGGNLTISSTPKIIRDRYRLDNLAPPFTPCFEQGMPGWGMSISPPPSYSGNSGRWKWKVKGITDSCKWSVTRLQLLIIYALNRHSESSSGFPLLAAVRQRRIAFQAGYTLERRKLLCFDTTEARGDTRRESRRTRRECAQLGGQQRARESFPRAASRPHCSTIQSRSHRRISKSVDTQRGDLVAEAHEQLVCKHRRYCFSVSASAAQIQDFPPAESRGAAYSINTTVVGRQDDNSGRREARAVGCITESFIDSSR